MFDPHVPVPTSVLQTVRDALYAAQRRERQRIEAGRKQGLVPGSRTDYGDALCLINWYLSDPSTEKTPLPTATNADTVPGFPAVRLEDE